MRGYKTPWEPEHLFLYTLLANQVLKINEFRDKFDEMAKEIKKERLGLKSFCERYVLPSAEAISKHDDQRKEES